MAKPVISQVNNPCQSLQYCNLYEKYKHDSDNPQNFNVGNTVFSVGWRRGISPPRSHRSGRKPLDLSGSSHLIDFYNRPCFSHRFLPSLVDQSLKPDEPTPSLHPHYRDFITTTSWSAPVPRIGTLVLGGPPLEFLP